MNKNIPNFVSELNLTENQNNLTNYENPKTKHKRSKSANKPNANKENSKVEKSVFIVNSRKKTKVGYWKDSCKWKCLFCGGKKCHHELVEYCPNPPAIPGLHSSWVTDDMIAMQRPSERLIKEYNIIQSYKEFYNYKFSLNIGAIFNLQEPGEHAKCGDGVLKESGFHYLPETFFNSFC